MSIKLDTFPSECKSKNKTFFKRGIKIEAKNYSPISLLSLISKVIEKSIYDQTQDYLQRNGFINEALKQISPQTHVCLG